MDDLFVVNTYKKREIIDITDKINEILKKQKKDNGLIYLFLLHTTCSLTTADLDPGAESDYLTAFEKISPNAKYIHPHNPFHFPDHFLSSIVGTFLLLPYEKNELVLGTWQRIILVEFDGPRERKIYFKLI